jgi:hypothetical protein
VVIEVTGEMKTAFRAAQERRAAELVAEGAPLGAHDILDQGLAAVLAVVKRDYRVEPRPPLERGGMADLYDCCAAAPTEPHRDDCPANPTGGVP